MVNKTHFEVGRASLICSFAAYCVANYCGMGEEQVQVLFFLLRFQLLINPGKIRKKYLTGSLISAYFLQNGLTQFNGVLVGTVIISLWPVLVGK